MKKLHEYLPIEFLQGEFNDTKAYGFKDVEVVREVDSRVEPWPSTHKNVLYWYELTNGYLVGFNENPARGWSFPICKKVKAIGE